MKRCPTCGEHYPDKEKFCEQDGTPLGASEKLAARSDNASSPWLVGIAGLVVGVSVCALALLFYFFSTRGETDRPQSNQRAATRQEGAEAPSQSVVSATPPRESADATPTPVESPSPSPTPTPTPAATPPMSPLRMLSDAPASTNAQSGNRIVIGLNDGTDIVADDAWRMQDGVWYRRGSLVTFLDPARIRSIERQQPRKPEP